MGSSERMRTNCHFSRCAPRSFRGEMYYESWGYIDENFCEKLLLLLLMLLQGQKRVTEEMRRRNLLVAVKWRSKGTTDFFSIQRRIVLPVGCWNSSFCTNFQSTNGNIEIALSFAPFCYSFPKNPFASAVKYTYDNLHFTCDNSTRKVPKIALRWKELMVLHVIISYGIAATLEANTSYWRSYRSLRWAWHLGRIPSCSGDKNCEIKVCSVHVYFGVLYANLSLRFMQLQSFG